MILILAGGLCQRLRVSLWYLMTSSNIHGAAGDNLQTTAELGTVPSRSWSDAALQALPWSVRTRLQREIGAGVLRLVFSFTLG